MTSKKLSNILNKFAICTAEISCRQTFWTYYISLCLRPSVLSSAAYNFFIIRSSSFLCAILSRFLLIFRDFRVPPIEKVVHSDKYNDPYPNIAFILSYVVY